MRSRSEQAQQPKTTPSTSRGSLGGEVFEYTLGDQLREHPRDMLPRTFQLASSLCDRQLKLPIGIQMLQTAE